MGAPIAECDSATASDEGRPSTADVVNHRPMYGADQHPPQTLTPTPLGPNAAPPDGEAPPPTAKRTLVQRCEAKYAFGTDGGPDPTQCQFVAWHLRIIRSVRPPLTAHKSRGAGGPRQRGVAARGAPTPPRSSVRRWSPRPTGTATGPSRHDLTARHRRCVPGYVEPEEHRSRGCAAAVTSPPPRWTRTSWARSAPRETRWVRR